MSKRRNLWLEFGCFLTGYNYRILMGCSERSVKRVIRYTSALLIICLLWAFIGFTFTTRYLKGDWYTSIIGAILMVVVVIQVERQVILSNKGNLLPYVFRFIIAFLMGLIGSIIIDQIIFKEDVEQRKELLIPKRVDEQFIPKAADLNRQIEELKLVILAQGDEYKKIMAESPMIQISERIRNVKHAGTDSAKVEYTVITKQIANPRLDLLSDINKKLAELHQEKSRKDNEILALRPQVESDVRNRTGFLDELEIMFSIITDSNIAMLTWGIWFLLLLGLEMFILVSKVKEPETDYDVVVRQQEELHLKRLRLLIQQ